MKLKQMRYTPEFLLGLVRGKYEVVKNPVPADARIVSAGYDYNRNVFYLNIASEEFPSTHPGEVLINLPPAVIRQIEEAGE